MRSVPRPRREVGPGWKPLLAVFFRYSSGRDAYVLRVFGNRFGPVMRQRPTMHPRMPRVVR